MKRASIAMLAVVAGVYGCATTESQDSSTSTTDATPSSSGTQSAGVKQGTARAPVQMGKGTGRAGATSSDPDKRSVYYEFDKYDVKAEYRALVESHARWLRSNPKARLTVEGNSDERGSREYNVALGQRRAESVTKMLLLMGAKPEQIEAISWGEEKPRDSGHNETGWSENRRSDFAPK
ncbi:MAG TPA: peptidoglycan-associated lipoprotein Pal [Burkholderiales bacterium]|nr:peptidoglycan-associated lipoprotein Pal [Burkholderiales bacterium]